MRIIAFIITVLAFMRCTTNTEVDLIVYNAKVYTVDSMFSTTEAFAVKNGVFVDIGKSEDILKRYSAKETIDAQQKAVFPGLYDAHGHSFLLSNSIQEVNLIGATSMEEVIERLKVHQRKYPHKKWIVGNGWDQNLWKDKEFPTKDSLDVHFPNTAIFLNRIDYHASLVNTKALHIAQIDSAMLIEGGIIVSDDLGNPTGVLIDNAMQLVQKFIPIDTEQHILTKLRQSQDSLFSVGVTSIVDAGLTEEQLDLLKNFYLKDSLKIRNYAMIFAEPHTIKRIVKEGTYETDRLTIKAIKFLADGALGSRGACLLENYSDDTTQRGFLLYSPEEFDLTLETLAASPFQVAIHAIGDSTNRLILDLYGKHLKTKNNRRWRIEHAQVVAPEDFIKFKKYSIIPSIQPTHATSDMNWVEARLGSERTKGAYAYKDLLKQYGKVVIGTDFPIESFNPFYSFYAAITRQDKYGNPKNGFQPEQKLTREEALRGMTIWAAFSCFQEDKRGSIERGKDADFIILDQDIMTVDVHKIRNSKVLRTVLAGETVYAN